MIETREHELISRIIDREASSAEWREFETRAQTDQALWRQLAQAQRDHQALSLALDGAAAVADGLALPGPIDPSMPLRLNRLGAWTGWAVAAAIALIAFVQYSATFHSSPSPSPNVHQAGVSFQSAADAFQAYLEKGRESGEVVGEMPNRVLVESKPALSGNGVEVIYIRQVMERTIVPDLYQFAGQDEAGRPTLVRYEKPIGNSM